MDVAQVDTDDGLEDFDAAAAFLGQWEKAAQEEPSATDDTDSKKKKAAPPTDDTDEQSPPEEVQDAQDEPEGDDEESDEPTFVENDDVFVKVKVGDEEHTASIRDLKRLFGQEAALTRKSQEFAAERKRVTEQATLHVSALNTMLQRARERFEPYQKADWATAARTLDPATFEAAREAAQAAYADVRYFEEELTGVTQKAQAAARDAHVKAAQACITALSDPDGGIEGWGEPLYKEIVGFAKEQGLDPDIADQLTDPAAFKLLHMAMQYQRGKQKVTKAVEDKKAEKKKAPPKKIVKASKAPKSKEQHGNTKVAQSMKKLASTGTVDDAEAAFLARWEAAADEDK
jgi:hypothetical protein